MSWTWLVIVEGDRSNYFIIFKLAAINETYEMTDILATISYLHCTDLKNFYLAGDLKATVNGGCQTFSITWREFPVIKAR